MYSCDPTDGHNINIAMMIDAAVGYIDHRAVIHLSVQSSDSSDRID